MAYDKMVKHLLVGFFLVFVSGAFANTVTRTFQIELSDQARVSNLVEVKKPVIEGCLDYRILETHRQSSSADPVISITQFRFANCKIKKLVFSYTYRLLKKLMTDRYCSYSVTIYENELTAGPQGRISGDCGFEINKITQSNDRHRFIITANKSG